MNTHDLIIQNEQGELIRMVPGLAVKDSNGTFLGLFSFREMDECLANPSACEQKQPMLDQMLEQAKREQAKTGTGQVQQSREIVGERKRNE